MFYSNLLEIIEPVKLSICVPTYNRAGLLKEALTAIAVQGDWTQFKGVEVLVSDNASADDTPEVVLAFQKNYSDITLHYLRHPQNIGMDANLYGVVQRAVGEFVLVLSDDDVLLPGALEKLLVASQKYPDVDAICLNMRSFANSPMEQTPAILKIEEDICLPDRNAALLFFGTWITFLSIVAFRKSALDKEGYQKRLGTYFVLSYLFLDVLKRGAVVFCQPSVAVRDNYVGGYNFFEVFVTRFQQLLLCARERGYSSEATQQVFQQHLRKFLFPFILNFKLRHSVKKPVMNYREGAVRMLGTYRANWFLFFVMLPVLLIPPTVLEKAYLLWRSFNFGMKSAKPKRLFI